MGESLQRVFILPFSFLVFPWITFAQLNMNFLLCAISPLLPSPSMHHFCSHTQSISFAHVTIETLARMLLTFRETSEKHLSCPQEQLESMHWSWVSAPIICVLSAADSREGASLLPSPSSQDHSHPGNRQTGTHRVRHNEYLTRKVAAWMP